MRNHIVVGYRVVEIDDEMKKEYILHENSSKVYTFDMDDE